MKNQYQYNYSSILAMLMALYLFMGVAHSTFSQVYPINATTQIAPPYSVFISDYVAPGSEQLKLNLFLRDLTEPVYDVRLRLVIEGQGVRIETSPTYNPPPITIEGGLSTWLDATDLAPLFESRNLIFSGYSKSEFERYGRLPEGFYQFCFTVYDYRHPEIQLSQQSCQNLWLVRPDPPMLNQPACAAELELNEMQQSVIFQWTPMAISPNSSFTTDYIFRLYEIRSEGRNPADIVLSTNPIYELQTAEMSLLYGVAEPPLVPGMEYVWQVQAIDLGGRDRFKNNGYSKICTFRVAENEEPLPEPDEFKAWGLNESMGMASWIPSLEPDGYTVEYRLADNPQAEWFVEELQLPPDAQLADSMYVVLQDLMAQTAYEVRIGSKRGAFVSSWTETKRFTTLPPREFACGDPQEVQQPLNTTPLISAIRGEVFTVGDFNMRLTKVTGGDGVFSGYGSVETPFLGVNLAVKFDNIRVNELYQVVDGEVIALSDGIDGLIEAWEDDEGIDSDDDDENTSDESSDTNDDFDGVDIDYDGEISDVTVGDDGVIVVTDESGMEHTYEQPVDLETGEKEDVRFTDGSGDTWIVDGEGNVLQGNGNVTDDETIDTEKELIKEALEYFKQEITIYLENSEKGPLDEVLLRRIQSLPDCLPKDEEKLQAILGKIDDLINEPDNLLALIKEDDINGPQVELMVDQLKGKRPPYSSELSEEQWNQLIQMLCPYLVEEEELPELVSIVPITDEEFTAGIDDDKLEISYSIKTTDKYPLKYAKLEIYKNDGTLAYLNDQDIKISENALFYWDGKMNQGDSKDKYIRYDESPFEVRVIASSNQEFKNEFLAKSKGSTNKYVDEWRDNQEMHKHVASHPKWTKFEYYIEMRDQIVIKISGDDETFLKDYNNSPLDYYSKNIKTISFLGQNIDVHNNYYNVLKGIENSMGGPSSAYYNNKKYGIGGFSIRFQNSEPVISNHAFGMALDVDFKYNPQLYNRALFMIGLLSNITLVKTVSSVDEMKKANSLIMDMKISRSDIKNIESGYKVIEEHRDRYQGIDLQLIGAMSEESKGLYKEFIEIYNRTKFLSNERHFFANPERYTEKEIKALKEEFYQKIPEKLNMLLNKINSFDKDKISIYRKIIKEGYGPAMLLDVHIRPDYQSLISDLDNSEKLNSINVVIDNLLRVTRSEDIPADFTAQVGEVNLTFSNSSSLNKVLNHINKVNNDYQKAFGQINSYSEIIKWFDKGTVFSFYSIASLNIFDFYIQLSEIGFFRLDKAFVNEFIKPEYLGKIRWGGFYKTKSKDWMHFEYIDKQRFIVD
ncbi:hypothetical protein JMN32_24985 [Fulvivirga sp. 29W222]|uniref:Fibronectin type-III domain-containing protein n=1 Tax=Fulvivirga marina TaxID=2494733 RepID=A0A937G0J4_9BACT|nr:hypothetical protein [Fulvivirga marina]MBL6449590.1 hypothetical protein [Fulvivirga marina]